jgi:uncharacterized protein (DUF2336 family)
MTVATSLIPGLDEIVRHGDPSRRAEAAHRIAELFFEGAAKLRPSHVELFDGLLIELVPFTEIIARAELAERLSLLSNAPRTLVGQLARENEILVAAPILRRSPVLEEEVLLEIAQQKGQGHLLAMSERPKLSSDLTDVIIRRGDRDVVRRAAGNAGAVFSDNGYSELIKRSGRDGLLTLAVGQRADLSDARLKDLLAGSLDVVRRRLLDVVKPERHAVITQTMIELAGLDEHIGGRRNFAPAQRAILALHAAGELNEAGLFAFAKSHRYEESIAALAAMSGVKITALDRLISGDRYDPILIIARKLGLEWATVRALILMRLGPNRIVAPEDIERSRVKFARLMPSTAERVVSFWMAQQMVV